MTARLGTVWYWLAVGAAVALITAAVLWNGWTFSQHGKAQRQLDSLGVDTAAVVAAPPPSGSAEAIELEILIEADRRGILVEDFQALLTEPQKRALALARRGRVADRADERKTSLIFGVVLILGASFAYWAGRRARRRSA